MPPKKEKAQPSIAPAFDSRLNAFEPVPMVVDFHRSYHKTFKRINQQENTHIFRLYDPEGFMNAQSTAIRISGRIMALKEDGTTEPVKLLSRMKKLTVSSTLCLMLAQMEHRCWFRRQMDSCHHRPK